MAKPNVAELKRTKVHVRKDDTVIVLSGKDQGKKGKVTAVIPQDGKVLVDGVNIAKRHTKPRPGQHAGGIMEKNLPLSASKVQLVCPRCGKPTRIAKKATQVDGKTVYTRVCKHCSEEI